MKILIEILFLCLLVNPVFTQISITWQKVYISPFTWKENYGEEICKADGSNYYIIGYNRYPYKSQIVKINEYGDTLWQRFIDSTISTSGTTSNDYGCIIAGHTTPPFSSRFFAKFNTDGDIEWNKRYDSLNGAFIYKIIKSTDNQYIACGNSYDYGYLIKTDGNGNLIFQKLFYAGYYKRFYNITEAYGGGYVAAGYEIDYQYGSPCGTVTRFDTSGNIIWEKRYSLNDTNIAQIKSIDKINNSYILGSSRRNRTCIVRIDTAGNLLSSNLYGDSQFEYSTNDVKAINTNKYIFASKIFKSNPFTVNTRVYIIDSSGNIIKDKIFNQTSIFDLNRLLPLNNGDILFTGSCNYPNEYNETMLAVRTDSNLSSPPIGILNTKEIFPVNYLLEQNYPNPFNPITKIKIDIGTPLPPFAKGGTSIVKLMIYDVLGKEIATLLSEQLNPGTYEIEWDASNFAGGIYFYQLKTPLYTETKKMVLLK